MKTLLTIIILSFLSFLSYSQSKTEYGVTTEGSWFLPHQSIREFSTKNGFGAGIGAYASQNIFWRFSADGGIMYRYKQMQQHYIVLPANGGGYGDPLSITTDGWDKLSLHYIVLPIHLQLLLSKSFFIRGGIETTWLTNYDIVNEKPEFNWIVGLGSAKHKLTWSVNYIKGFKDQGFGNKTVDADGHYKGSINRHYTE